jgi:serine/threonine protein kinase
VFGDDLRLRRLVAKSGTEWVIDERKQAGLARRTTPYLAWPADRPAEIAWAQRLSGGAEFDDDRRHLCRKFDVSSIPSVRASPYILRTLDLAESFDTYLISERADTTLDAALHMGLDDATASRIEQSVRAALDVLHGLGLVHCDVREDNVFLVGEAWKLGDLGSAVPEGALLLDLARESEYRAPGVKPGAAATRVQDLFALNVIIAHMKASRRP